MAHDTTRKQSTLFSVLKNRNFLLLLSAMLVSEFGSGITAIASSILVFRETGSAASVGLMLMATSLPGLLFGLLAGVFVDRVNRKYMIIVTELVSGFMILLIPFMLEQGIIWLYILVALKSTAYQFFSPALNSILPDIAGDEELAAANSLISASHTGAMGLGFAAAGYITSQLSVEWAFYIDSSTFFLAAGLITLLSVPTIAVQDESSVTSIFINLRQGASFLLRSPALRSVILLTIPMGIIFGFWNSAMLPFSITALGATEFEYSLIEGIGLIGFVLGSLTMGILGDRLREGQWLAISFIGMGLLSIFYSQLTSIWMAIIVNSLVLYLNVPSFVARSLIIQRNTTREVRGRVSSVYFVSRDFSFVIGMALVGIADVIDIRTALLAFACILTLVGFGSLFLPGLRRSTEEWRHSVELLRGISEAKGLDTGRSITMDDLDRLGQVIPEFGSLDMAIQQKIMPDMTYTEANTGTVIIHKGEVNDNCYFILEGQAIAGTSENRQEKILEILNSGDFFGEIAALTGQPRTANVIAKEAIHLLRVPAHALRELIKDPTINRLFYSKMMDRMMRMNMVDLPRMGRLDQDSARSTRSKATV